jgi:putative membrane protein
VNQLVLCVDRSSDLGRSTGRSFPVVGEGEVAELAMVAGRADPEDSRVNTLLEALRVYDSLGAEGADRLIAVIAGGSDSPIGVDRSLAAQLDGLIRRYAIGSVIVVVDSADDERVIPVIESRLRVDAVDRVVVRQAHDLQSTYYLLKQFLADEELRSTILVPLGAILVFLPILLIQFSPAVAGAGLAALLGAVLLYKGLAIDEYIEEVPERVQIALYSGQVSVVTYAVGAGLALVGIFLGALSVPAQMGPGFVLVRTLQFVYNAVPWLALAALTVSAGRLLDELITTDALARPYLNLPFGIVALGLVVRGFAGWFLQREGALAMLVVARWEVSAPARLAAFIIAAIVVSLIGVRVANTVTAGTQTPTR